MDAKSMTRDEAINVAKDALQLLVDAIADKDIPATLADVLNYATTQLDTYNNALTILGDGANGTADSHQI